MGLDAHVNCDCFEKGRMRTPPRAEWEVFVDEDGSRATRARDLETQLAFDEWSCGACEHENGIVIHHRIGNMATVRYIRGMLQQKPEDFPVIISKVVYSGVHAGDWLTVDEVNAMVAELDRLAQFHLPDPGDEEWLRYFEKLMHELAECSLRFKKPLVF
jgi:hypothetical protein